MLLGDEDVRHAALARDLLEGVLEGGSVFCTSPKEKKVLVKTPSSSKRSQKIHRTPGLYGGAGENRTNFVQLHEEVLGVHFVQQRLGRATVRAVRLGEHHDGVLVDDLLGLGFCVDHGCGRCSGSKKGSRETAEGRQY